ncbi:histone deacetylase [Kitasatospora sp. NPDC091207]|uniref:histone deacetylase n=1 Tax=Kitasatospora sp. NPDC091207 TaxID=3364083 RepID=UPI0038159C2C
MSETRPVDDRSAPQARRAEPLSGALPLGDKVWYAAYGSNMHADRLAHYIAGGRPPGGALTYPGCRDRRLPERTLPVLLPGALYFALESAVWTGGMGFYDPAADGEMPARAYLVTTEQFADIAAQEMRRHPGTDLDLTRALAAGSDHLGPGRYETLVCPGAIEDVPVFTFTAPWALADAELNVPCAAYLANFAAGLAEAHGWSPEQAAAYLADRPGAAGHWSADAVLAALRPASALP